MVWNQYMDDIPPVVSDDMEEDQDEPIIPRNRPMNYQDWITWYSDDLFNLWMNIRSYREECGLQRFLLNNLDWNEFCEICYYYSSKLPK